MYDDLMRRKIMASLVDLFHLSAAIGISFGERKPITGPEELVNVYSIDKDNVFSTLLEEMFPDMQPEQRLDILEEYSEAGIRYLSQQAEKYHMIDWTKLLSQLSGS